MAFVNRQDSSKQWTGKPPSNCDICNAPITTEFVDGKTRMGPWANMCIPCHKSHGCGIGVGRGQAYMLDPASLVAKQQARSLPDDFVDQDHDGLG